MQNLLKVTLEHESHKLTIVDASSFPGILFLNLLPVTLHPNQVLQVLVETGDNITYIRKDKHLVSNRALCSFDIEERHIAVLSSNIDLVILNE